jgi:hypothetical protein
MKQRRSRKRNTESSATNRSSTTFTIVDVGSNKGYSVAAMLEAMNVSLEHFSRKALAYEIYKYAEERNVPGPEMRHALLGACCDGSEGSVFEKPELRNHPWFSKRRKEISPPENIEVFMFDGSQAHMDFSKHYFTNAFEKYYNSTKNSSSSTATRKYFSNITFHFERKAVSDSDGATAVFCQEPLGNEVGSICEDATTTITTIASNNETTTTTSIVETTTSNTSTIPVVVKRGPGESYKLETEIVSLGKFLPPHVETIDMLLTDTEGHDFDVLDGARERFLKPGKVAIYIFELHRHPTKLKQQQRPLGDVVAELESYGYTIFMPIHRQRGTHRRDKGVNKRHVVRMSSTVGECWRESYNTVFRGWKNMIAVHLTNFPELKLVFYELERMPKYHTFVWCNLPFAKAHFFDRNPSQNWTWALQNLLTPPPPPPPQYAHAD